MPACADAATPNPPGSQRRSPTMAATIFGRSSPRGLDSRPEADPLIDCALRVEFGCNIGTPDDMHDEIFSGEPVGQLTQRLLTGAKHDPIHFEVARIPAMLRK